MCDSAIYHFYMNSMSSDDYSEANFPFDILQSCDNYGELKPSFFRWMTSKSPLTGEAFKIKAIPIAGGGYHPQLAGYCVEINLPACTVGNNLLLTNWLLKGSRVALLLFQCWLADRGCSSVGISAFSLKRACIKSVTLTYLLPCIDNVDAHAAREEMYSHGAAIHNKKYRGKPLLKSQVFKVGTNEQATVYMKHHDFNICVYVKDGAVGGASSFFPSAEIEDEIRAEAKKYLRVEITLGQAWLYKHNRHQVKSWRYIKENSPYDIGIQLIRTYLRLDEKLRIRRPKAEHIESLNRGDKRILDLHLSGQNVRQHPRLAGKNHLKFYPMRKRILNETRIDISMPWEVQNKCLSPRLGTLLSNPGQYHPPMKLVDHVFYDPTVADVICRLEQLLKEKLQAG